MSIYPIVGALYRPPAKSILANLPAEHALFLRREPTNPYDANAIQVLVSTETIPENLHKEIGEHAEGFGFSWDDIAESEEWHLGYIPKDLAAVLAPKLDAIAEDIPAQLAFNSKGAPQASFDLPE